jgi:release factor glutamine methyltransferase
MECSDLPEAYQAGFINFLGLKIDLSKKPLIPREETEQWVAKAIEEIKKSPKEKIKCLDIFSGSGCVGLAVLKNIPNAVCDFVDIENNFLDQIKINLDLNEVSPERYQIIKSDVFSNIKRKYDFILANPPYVAEERADEIGEDVKKYEPMIALMAGPQGMDFIKLLLEQSRDYLEKAGTVYIEIDPKQKELIEPFLGAYSKREFLEDQFGKIRILRIKL